MRLGRAQSQAGVIYLALVQGRALKLTNTRGKRGRRPFVDKGRSNISGGFA